MSVRISVVVPTFRRHHLLARCLKALVEQNFAQGSYEVIVADDAECAETRQIVERWAASGEPAIRYLPVRHAHGPAAARNAGWQAASGEAIAFTDDDCLPNPGWLAAGLAALSAGASAVWGKLEMPLPAKPTDYERDAAGLAQAEFVTANCFCTKAALVQVGGFDERFQAAWREDSDLYFSLLERGCHIVHAPDAVVVHPIRAAPWGVSLRQQAKSRFDALLFSKHPTLYRCHIDPMPLRYYAIGGSLAAILTGTLASWTSLFWVGVAAWVWLTGAFCLRRLRGASKAPAHVAEMVVTSALIPPLSLYWRLRGAWAFRVFFF